jgi:hypothetical protein
LFVVKRCGNSVCGVDHRGFDLTQHSRNLTQLSRQSEVSTTAVALATIAQGAGGAGCFNTVLELGELRDSRLVKSAIHVPDYELLVSILPDHLRARINVPRRSHGKLAPPQQAATRARQAPLEMRKDFGVQWFHSARSSITELCHPMLGRGPKAIPEPLDGSLVPVIAIVGTQMNLFCAQPEKLGQYSSNIASRLRSHHCEHSEWESARPELRNTLEYAIVSSLA